MIIFGPPNIEKMKAKKNINGLIKALDYKKWEVEEDARRALVRIGKASLEPLIAAFIDESGAQRWKLARVLGMIGNARAVEHLITALKDNDLNVRKTAAYALGRIADARATEPLIVTLKDDDSSVREAVAEALGMIGDSRAIDPLIVTIKDENSSVRKAAGWALCKIGEPNAIKAVIGALKDNEFLLSETTLKELGNIGDARAVEALTVAMRYGHLRNAAQAILMKIGASAVEQLISVLKDDDQIARNAAIKVLGNIGESAVEPLIAELKGGDLTVKKAAIRVLYEIGDPRAIEPLIAFLKDEAPDVREATAGALEKLGWKPDQEETGAWYWVSKRDWESAISLGASAVNPLIETLKDKDWNVRKTAVYALGKIGDARAVEPLIAALKDENWKVREAATQSLSEIGEPALKPLIAALKDRNNNMLRLAAEALGGIGDARAFEPLIAALNNKETFVREAAAGALVKIGEYSIKPLIAVLKNENQNVRKVAAETLDKLGWKPNRDETGALYWVAKSEWENVIDTGSAAVQPLIALLMNKCTSRLSIRAAISSDRPAAARALGKIGDTKALEPLITTLKDEDETVREAAAEALGKIGDARAIEPLIAALKEKATYVRKAAAGALEILGWKPDCGEDGAWYWIAKRDWEKASALGFPAVEPLIIALKDGVLWADDREAVVSALVKIDDARAVEPLIATLKNELWPVREAAAETLVSIYHRGLLDESSKSKILSVRKVITEPHRDSPSCYDFPHTDDGIGVDFPL